MMARYITNCTNQTISFFRPQKFDQAMVSFSTKVDNFYYNRSVNVRTGVGWGTWGYSMWKGGGIMWWLHGVRKNCLHSYMLGFCNVNNQYTSAGIPKCRCDVICLGS